MIATNEETITIKAELTDTFGGEANYSWVKRCTLTLPSKSSELQIVRAVKDSMGLTGVKCARDDMGETIVLRPFNSCTVLFIDHEWS